MKTRLGIFIQTKREGLNLSRKEFCEQMTEESRISPSTLGQIEIGRIKRPPDKRLKGFATILGVTTKTLQKLLVIASVITMISVMPILFPKEAKAIELIQKYEPAEGYHVAFSGGKDSIVMYNLVRKAAVKHKAYMALTTIDPPELIKFIKRNYPEVNFLKPKYSMFKLISEVKHSLPTRGGRYCCEHLKEYAGRGEFTVLGVRAQESAKRASRDFFEHDTRKNMIGKMYLNPILDWLEDEVWKYIFHYNLPYPDLYDNGKSRIGCIGCPLAGVKNMRKELEEYPRFKKMYLKAIKKARKGITKKGGEYAIKYHFHDEYDAMEWWLSDLSIKNYLELKRTPQLKLDL